MREIRTSGLMSGDGKRGIATAPVLDSTIHRRSIVNCKFAWFAIALRVAERHKQGWPKNRLFFLRSPQVTHSALICLQDLGLRHPLSQDV
jgi:hypothetical protein